tara:strand:+ start:11528 stop:12421 length:894 start_codon:yes stop_codon:yes gene_type:complete
MNEDGKPDYRYAVIDRAWWDFDAGERGGIELVKRDVAELIKRLDGDLRVVATGRGFHVHQLFNESVCGPEYRLSLEHYQRRKAHGLATLDGVGFPEKMTRIPNTYNPKRGRWCVVIDGRAFAEDPDNFVIPKSPQILPRTLHPFGRRAHWHGCFDFKDWAQKYAPEAEDYSFVDRVELDDKTLTAGTVPLMPCLARAVHGSKPNHHVRVALVQHMADTLRDFADPDALTKDQRVAIEDEIFDYIKGLGWSNWNATNSRKGIKSTMKYRRVPSCAWFVARGMCAAKCWRYDGTVEVPK